MPLPEPFSALILIVDDYPDSLEMYDEYLSFNGYRVITAKGGIDAVAAARIHRPALIFMDIEMPTFDGTEAMQLLRSDKTFDHVHIVALTAHALKGEREKALDAGFDEVVTKPCLLDALKQVVDRLLSKPRHAAVGLGNNSVHTTRQQLGTETGHQ